MVNVALRVVSGGFFIYFTNLNIEINLKTQKSNIMKKINLPLNFYKMPLDNIKWISANSRKKLSFASGVNRDIVPHQVNKMSDSVKKMAIIRPVVAAEFDFLEGIKKLYIIDGQHLVHALLRLGYDIPYVVIKIENKQELVEQIALLNSSSKSWALTDYVKAWGSLKEDYITLNQYAETYSIELSMVAAILSGNTVAHGSVVTRIIKNGTFAIMNVVDRMNRYENRYFISEYVKYVKEEGTYYNHEDFIKKLKKNKTDVALAIHSDGKLVEKFRTMQ